MYGFIIDHGIFTNLLVVFIMVVTLDLASLLNSVNFCVQELVELRKGTDLEEASVNRFIDPRALPVKKLVPGTQVDHLSRDWKEFFGF